MQLAVTEKRGIKRGEKTESTRVHAAREMGERTEERGTEVPDTEVTLSLYVRTRHKYFSESSYM